MAEIKFYKGDQEKYDSFEQKEENVFHITQSIKKDDTPINVNLEKLYIGDTLIGDAYVSQEDITATTTEKIGGIAAGSSLETILKNSGGSISKVLDNILFPEINPSITQPSIAIKNNAQNIVEVGQTGYTQNNFTVTPNRGSVSYSKINGEGSVVKNQLYAGEASNQKILTGGKEVTSEPNPTIFTYGTISYNASCDFAAGTAHPCTNKGNNVQSPYSGGTKTSSNTNVSVYWPTYFGEITDPSATIDTVTSEQIIAGTKKVQAGNILNNLITPVTTGGHAYFACPSQGGANLTIFYDQNSFDCTNAFSSKTISVTTALNQTLNYTLYFKGEADKGNSYSPIKRS